MDFLLYLLKVNIAIILFYGFYRLFFQQDTFFRWKRTALLAILFISFLYPFADIAGKFSLTETVGNALLPIYAVPEANIVGQAVVEQTAAEPTVSFVQSLPQLLFALYGIVVLLLLGRLLIQTGTIIRMMQDSQRTELYGQTIYRHPGIKTPFSFFRWIVLNPALYTDTELQEILRHEETHVREAHSMDTLLSELLCVFCWFNPFAWLLKREIRMNLEFLADRSVLASGYEAEHYQFHLLRLTYHKAAAKITNNFNVSLLKKRIFMMNKKQTSKLSIFKYTLLIPVIGALIVFNSACKPQNGTVEDTAETIETVEKEIWSYVEFMPSFPGGDAALKKWLNDNIQYPVIAAEQGIQGRVTVRFVIDPDGTVSSAEILQSLDPSCDREALRVVRKMPKWVPGKQNGKEVSVYFTVPIVFRLQGG